MTPPSHLSGPCPGTAQIERLAGGEEASADVSRHLEVCETCRARVESAREDAKFVARFRALSSPGLGPEGAPRLPGYRTLGVLSSGAQGVVYRAVQESTSRTVAIKALAAGESVSPRRRARAEREAEVAARLRHPNIVTVFESRTLGDGRIAVVMEYVDGVPLDMWKAPGKSAGERQRELLRVFVAVCRGIHHAHLNGVIHRDLKPDNILVTAGEGDGAGARPVVLDFGIAKLGGTALGGGGMQTTRTGEFAGTPAYASPEQVSGHPDEVDALTDVYSLGVILYRLLCGAMPYEVEGSIFDIARTIGQTEPVPPRQRAPGLSQDLEAIVLRAMRKEKERRYQSAASLARDLERYLAGDPVEARSASGWYLLRKAVVLNRGRLAWAGLGLVLVLGAGVAVVMSLASAADSARLADLRHQQARAENVRARAVTELLREALPNSDPAHPEMAGAIDSGLNRLYFRLETGAFADDPAVDQALRRLWGGVYTGLGSGKAAGLVEYAEVSLRNGLVRLREQHGQEHPDIAATMHELAGVLLVRKRATEAEAICRSALAMRERLLGPTDTSAADSRALLARILLNLGRTLDAVREADAALAVFRSRPDREADLAIASMTALKARVRLEAGDGAGGEPLVRESLLRRLRRLPPEDPELLASLADSADLAQRAPGSELASVLRAAWDSTPSSLPADLRRDVPLIGAPDRGDYRNIVHTGRTRALGRLIRLQEALLGPNDAALVGLLVAQVRAAEGEQLLDIRSRAMLRAADILAARFGPSDSSVLLCIEEAASVMIFADQADRAAELARRACDIWDTVPASARDLLLAGDSRRRVGWYLALAGRCGEAVPEYRRALQELGEAVGPEHHTVALAQSGLAYCLLETGDAPGADEHSGRALSLGERLSATPADQLAHIRFVRGHILRAMGRHEEARGLLQQAWEGFYRFLGPTFPWNRVLFEDMAAVCEAAGDPAAAALWRGRARGAGAGALPP